MKTIPTRLDRYPAKMVSRLAENLLDRYGSGCSSVLDPFCGSGAILAAAQRRGIPVTGVDVNPYAVLLSSVKLAGFDRTRAAECWSDLERYAKVFDVGMSIEWEAKGYWFTPRTLHKFELIRRAAAGMQLYSTPEGRAVLLAVALSVRLCSRADQRSPKPFVSKLAIARKRGRHLDPFLQIGRLLQDLSHLYGDVRGGSARTITADIAVQATATANIGEHSHVFTSPPYINAQDYFRNFKLELYILEKLLPFRVDDIRAQFIGTERGVPNDVLFGDAADRREGLLPELRDLRQRNPALARVVHNYLEKMHSALEVVAKCLAPGGVLVIVCGDNLVGGVRIKTWDVINRIVHSLGFTLYDSFCDSIQCRALAPARLGHKGLIKEEVVSAFRLRPPS